MRAGDAVRVDDVWGQSTRERSSSDLESAIGHVLISDPQGVAVEGERGPAADVVARGADTTAPTGGITDDGGGWRAVDDGPVDVRRRLVPFTHDEVAVGDAARDARGVAREVERAVRRGLHVQVGGEDAGRKGAGRAGVDIAAIGDLPVGEVAVHGHRSSATVAAAEGEAQREERQERKSTRA